MNIVPELQVAFQYQLLCDALNSLHMHFAYLGPVKTLLFARCPLPACCCCYLQVQVSFDVCPHRFVPDPSHVPQPGEEQRMLDIQECFKIPTVRYITSK
jgi:hypothetical protein